MKIRYSLDGAGLEEHLLASIAARPSGGLAEPVLVLVPTRRLADHLRLRLAERCGAALGVHLLTHHALAHRALELALEAPPRVLPPGALAELLDALLADYAGEGAEYLRGRAGARAALLAALRDLREAAVTPEACIGPGPEAGAHFKLAPAVAALYPRWVEALDRLAADGLADDAGLVDAARPHIAPFLAAKGIRRAIHHGAYELIGIHLELLEAIDAACDLELLLPGDPDSPAGEYAGRLMELATRRRPGTTCEPLAAGQGDARGRDCGAHRERFLERLARPGGGADGETPLEAPALEIRHAQGEEAELRAAALRALALAAREGVPLEETAIVARSLGPYLPFLEATLDGLGVPFTTSASAPARRSRRVAGFLRLLHVLAGDFERRAVIDLLRETRLRVEELDRADFRVDRWDRWSREGRVFSGLDAWRSLAEVVERRGRGEEDASDLERIEEDRASLGTLLAVLAALEEDRERWRRASSIDEHVAVLRGLFRRRLPAAPGRGGGDPEGALVERLLGNLALAASVRAAAGDGDAHAVEAVEAMLARLAEAETVRVRPHRNRGVRVLDLMRARGLVHRAVIWIGFHHDVFPRRARANPFLDDGVRREIAAALAAPLAPQLDVAAEERLLLAMTLASAGERVVISFQRADDGGRKRARSSALREVARVFLGRPDAAALLADDAENPFRPERVPAHPRDRAVALARSPAVGVCAAADALVAVAVGARDGPGAARRFIERAGPAAVEIPGSETALEAVESLERFDLSPLALRFDGRTGRPAPPDSHRAPTALERLARCPLAFFLRDVLGIRELEEEAAPHRIEGRAIGIAVHETLRELYAPLEGDRPPPAAAIDDLEREAASRLAEIWPRRLREAAGASWGRLRRLYELLGESWLGTLREFVADDVARLGGADRVHLERSVAAEVVLPDGTRVPIEGRLDRVVHAGGRFGIDDYKTGGRLSKWVKPGAVAAGEYLQLPLYREATAAAHGERPGDVSARLLGLGPEMDEKDREVELPAAASLRDALLETVGVAVALARSGRFPAFPDSTMCRYCSYARACRKGHEPTVHRFELDPALADYRDAKKKNAKQWTLEAVRSARTAAGDVEDENEGNGNGDEGGDER